MLQIYAETQLPTVVGSMRLRVYRDPLCQPPVAEPLALISGRLLPAEPVNLRIHSACLTSEVLGSCKCDCKLQLDNALQYIADHTGVVIYLHQEGRGIGLGDKVRAYALQEHGFDTIEANEMLGFPIDGRSYADAITILRDLGIKRVNLLTNNPDKLSALADAGIDVVARIALTGSVSNHANDYLATKRTKMGHLID